MEAQAIQAQSEAAYRQWSVQWRKHATQHATFEHKPFSDFENIGVGKALLCVANGYSFEENIDVIKRNQHNVDILACDKTLGHLIDHGIPPTYVMVCDANVNYKKYMEKWKGKLSKTTLFINVCANPEWSHNGNWKDIYFFTNRDILNSHEEFSRLSGTKNIIPAGTNVSNAMVILATQCDNNVRRNFFGYDKILLIGFDYSWKFGGKYYAFDEDGGGKSQYMRHSFLATKSGEYCYSSGNLAFSMQWLQEYITVFKLPVVQCGKDSLLSFGKTSELEPQMQYRYKPGDRYVVRDRVSELRRIETRAQQLRNEINNIGRDHYWSYARTT